MKKAYKLVRLRRDGSLGSLFIHRRAVLPIGKWMLAYFFPTKGYAPRQGWHVMPTPHAPHLSMKGRVWVRVLIRDYEEFTRPASQGGTWLLAQEMKIKEIMT